VPGLSRGEEVGPTLQLPAGLGGVQGLGVQQHEHGGIAGRRKACVRSQAGHDRIQITGSRGWRPTATPGSAPCVTPFPLFGAPMDPLLEALEPDHVLGRLDANAHLVPILGACEVQPVRGRTHGGAKDQVRLGDVTKAGMTVERPRCLRPPIPARGRRCLASTSPTRSGCRGFGDPRPATRGRDEGGAPTETTSPAGASFEDLTDRRRKGAIPRPWVDLRGRGRQAHPTSPVACGGTVVPSAESPRRRRSRGGSGPGPTSRSRPSGSRPRRPAATLSSPLPGRRSTVAAMPSPAGAPRRLRPIRPPAGRPVPSGITVPRSGGIVSTPSRCPELPSDARPRLRGRDLPAHRTVRGATTTGALAAVHRSSGPGRARRPAPLPGRLPPRRAPLVVPPPPSRHGRHHLRAAGRHHRARRAASGPVAPPGAGRRLSAGG